MNNIELKIEFWKELWADLINNFLKRSYGFRLYSPQVLIEDIIIEIEENKFKNPDNKRYFSLRVAEYIKDDEVVNSILKSDFALLQRAIHNNKNEYVLSLCKQIKYTLEKGVYFKQTLKLVEDIILSDKEIDIDFVNKINYYSQSLIVEFIMKTYVLEDIVTFIKNIFEKYYYHKNPVILMTKFPHDINYENYKTENGKSDRENYEQAVKDKIDKLTLKERINTLNYYYNKATEKVKYIFVIRGLKSETKIDKTILGVSFFSYDKKKMNNEDLDIGKDLQRDDDENEKYLQAKVDVDFLMEKSSSVIAKRKLETAFDLLHCYFNIKTPLSYSEHGYSIFKENDKKIFSKLGGNKSNSKFMLHLDSLDFSENEKHLNEINEFSFLWSDKSNNESISKIKNALRWHRKAEQSLRDEDKILNYWIALENLFNNNDLIDEIIDNPKNKKIQLIQEIVSSRQVFNFVYDYGWELYWYFRHYRDYHKSNIPQELKNKAQLNTETGEVIYLKNFIDNLDEIKKYETNLFIIEKINSVSKFYEDLDYARSIIDEHISNVKNDILMIYRLRNLIFHNAHYDNTLLPYYSWKFKKYCGGVLRKFIEEYDESKTLGSIIFDIYIDKEKYLMDFDNGKVNLFESEQIINP